MESRTDDLAARLLRCPVGCAFLLTIVRDQVPIEIAVTPPQAFARAAAALDALNPWSGDFERTVTAALSRGADLASLARAVVSHPQSRWWTAPMDPTRQVLVIDDTAHPTSARRAPPHPIWERIQRIFKRTSSRARRCPRRTSVGRTTRNARWDGGLLPRSGAHIRASIQQSRRASVTGPR